MQFDWEKESFLEKLENEVDNGKKDDFGSEILMNKLKKRLINLIYFGKNRLILKREKFVNLRTKWKSEKMSKRRSMGLGVEWCYNESCEKMNINIKTHFYLVGWMCGNNITGKL